jgi:hypothetical protein
MDRPPGRAGGGWTMRRSLLLLGDGCSSLTGRGPAHPLLSLRREVDRILDEFERDFTLSKSARSDARRIDIRAVA